MLQFDNEKIISKDITVNDVVEMILNEFTSCMYENIFFIYIKLDIENPIIRINTAFKGCSSLEKISVLPRIYHN